MIQKNKLDMLDGVLVVMVAILGNLAVQGIISFVSVAINIATKVNIIENTMFNLFAMMLLQLMFMVAPVIYFSVIKKKQPLLTIKMDNRTKPINYVFGALLAVVCLITFYLPTGWFGEFLNKINYRSAGGVNLNTVQEIIFGIIIMVVVAPFFEEIVFRGYLLSGLSSRYSTIKAVLISGAMFSLMHMNPEQTVYQFFLGCVCGFAAIKTKNLILPVIIHAASNLCALLMDLTALGTVINNAVAFATSTWYFSVLFTLGLLALGCTALFFIIRFMGKSNAVKVSQQPLATPAPATTTIPDLDVVALNNNQDLQLADSSAVAQEFADAEPIKQAAALNKRNKIALKVLLGVFAICAFMWIALFVTQIMPLPVLPAV